jgi:protein TonB
MNIQKYPQVPQAPRPLLFFLGLSALVHGGFLWLAPAQARPATVFREQRPRIALADLSLPAPPRQASPPQPGPAPAASPVAASPVAEASVEAPREAVSEYDGPAEEQTRETAAFSGETGLSPVLSPAAADPALRENAAGRYLAMIRSLIDRCKEYPYQARRQEQEGTVLVRFTITRQGMLLGEPSLEKKSRHGRLNASALEAVKNAAPYPPFPVEITDNTMSLQMAVNFSLK